MVDTMGAPFIYPIARWIYGTQVVAYVHYPVISTDMLERVSSRQEDYNNSSFVAKSRLLSFGKWMCVFYKFL